MTENCKEWRGSYSFGRTGNLLLKRKYLLARNSTSVLLELKIRKVWKYYRNKTNNQNGMDIKTLKQKKTFKISVIEPCVTSLILFNWNNDKTCEETTEISQEFFASNEELFCRYSVISIVVLLGCLWLIYMMILVRIVQLLVYLWIRLEVQLSQ